MKLESAETEVRRLCGNFWKLENSPIPFPCPSMRLPAIREEAQGAVQWNTGMERTNERMNEKKTTTATTEPRWIIEWNNQYRLSAEQLT